MNVITNTHLSTVRTIILTSTVLALALAGSGGLGVSALWAAPLLAVAACVTKLVIESTLPDHVANERPIELSLVGARTDAFV